MKKTLIFAAIAALSLTGCVATSTTPDHENQHTQNKWLETLAETARKMDHSTAKFKTWYCGLSKPTRVFLRASLNSGQHGSAATFKIGCGDG